MKTRVIKGERSGWRSGVKCPVCRAEVILVSSISSCDYGCCGCKRVLWSHKEREFVRLDPINVMSRRDSARWMTVMNDRGPARGTPVSIDMGKRFEARVRARTASH